MGILRKITPFERKELFIAWIAISIAFTVALASSGGIVSIIGQISNGNLPTFNGTQLLIAFIAALIIVGFSFILHELAHKFSAIRYGYWAEFRKSNPMLVISICVSVLLGIVFAAPGATVINTGGKEISSRENGIISIVGPLTNIGLIIVFAVIMIIGGLLGGGTIFTTGFIYTPSVPGFLFYLGYTGWMVNAMFALFNMLPVGPLDGKKVMQWNPLLCILMIAVSFFLLYIMFDFNMLSAIFNFFVPQAIPV